jgi:hypothetical protein
MIEHAATTTPPEYTVRVLNKQTSKGWRVDEVSVSIRFHDGDLSVSLDDSISNALEVANLSAQMECDRLNRLNREMGYAES